MSNYTVLKKVKKLEKLFKPKKWEPIEIVWADGTVIGTVKVPVKE